MVRKKKERFEKLRGFLKDIDIFGERIRLKYKGKPTIPSFFGGLMTVSVLILTLLFLWGKIIKLLYS